MPILSVGGASRLMSEIIPRINNSKGFEAELLIGRCLNSQFAPTFKNAGVKVHILGYQLYNPMNIIKIGRFLKHFDLIHVNLFPALYWVAFANLTARKPLIYTEHSTNNKRRNKWYIRAVEKWVYRQYSKIISISEGTERNIMQWLQACENDKRFMVINNGINIESFSSCKRERIYPHTLIMISRFVPAKDHATIIRAMGLVGNDIHLLLVGDGEKLEECKALANETGVSERVHFLGNQSNIPEWIGKSDVGIQSSHWEGFGLTAVEMMAGGLPVVASDVDGIRQVVDGAGVLFPHGDVQKLADIINQLFSDKDYYENIKKRCMDRCKKYDIYAVVNNYMELYREIEDNK